jgi:predicted nucleic acid-binding protein
MPLVLSDTTVLSNFSHVGRPDLLREAFPDLASPRVVFTELKRGENLGRVPVCDWSWLKVFDSTDDERLRAMELERVLQPGEAVCLAMSEARGALFLTDDSVLGRLL